MSTIEKPQLRGLLQLQIKRNIIGMAVVSISSALMYKIFIADARKKRYANFYKYVIFKILQFSILFSSLLDSYNLHMVIRS